MTERIRLLKEDISECMYRKFNGKVNLDELEEAILRRLVAEMRTSLGDVKKEYENKILELQVQHTSLQNCSTESNRELCLIIDNYRIG